MIKKGGRESLADKIAGVLSAAPVSVDPEDDTNEETSAKVADFEEEDNDEDEILLSKFRKQNIDLLEDIDTRYAGKKGSRKDFKDSSDDEDGNEIDSEDEDNSEDSEIDDEEEGDSEIDDEEDEKSDSDEDDGELLDEDDNNFKHMKETNISAQINKGQCVRNQLSLWESFLEMRIQLQKCLITSNKMPQYDIFKEMKESGNDFINKVNETKKTLSNVLDKMLELQTVCLAKFPETKKLSKGEAKIVDDDEEIASDTEKSSEEDDEITESPKKKLKIVDYENAISKTHDAYKTYRNSVIQKWNEKTRIAVGKNQSNHSVLNQIEHNLKDRNKLIKRTQIKRSDYDIIGVKRTAPQMEEGSSKIMQECQSEIFDDDDFYHQLLRELIEVKSADLTDPVQLGRQWIQLQNLRSKMKRKIDTRATKGRKIRYAIHTKLVNFMPPIDDANWTDDAKNELYNSLFGKSQVAIKV